MTHSAESTEGEEPEQILVAQQDWERMVTMVNTAGSVLRQVCDAAGVSTDTPIAVLVQRILQMRTVTEANASAITSAAFDFYNTVSEVMYKAGKIGNAEGQQNVGR